MPILEEEVYLHPQDLFEHSYQELQAENENGLNWYAFYTISRQEKQMMRRLLKSAAAFYSPVVEKKQRSPAGRLRTSFVPLFSNYVFVFGDLDAKIKAFETNCVSRCIDVTDPAALHIQLASLNQLILLGEPVTLEEKLVEGMKVRIKSGPLKGMTGTIFQRKGQDRLMVAVNFLQQGASIEFRNWELEPYQ